MTDTLRERYYSRVEIRGPDECWPYTGPTNPDRYPMIRDSQPPYMPIAINRLAWIFGKGAIPPSHKVKKCPTLPTCGNPAHLEVQGPGTMRVKGKRQPPPQLRGEQNPLAKLNDAAVRQIRTANLSGLGDKARLARELGISLGLLSKVLKGERWAHVQTTSS